MGHSMPQYLPVQKETRARKRAETVLRILRATHGPVPLNYLIEAAGPYHLEVHQVLATLEALGLVERFEEDSSERGAHRVAYQYHRVTPRRRSTGRSRVGSTA